MILEKAWKQFNITEQETLHWISRNKIPIGTEKPPYEYTDGIPEEEIVTIKFDPISTPMTKRSAFNILVLAGSGDGKSLLAKNLWFYLQKAGFYILYIDPKSADSGRAKNSWVNNRTAPYTSAEGIKLKHYMPVFATKDYDHLIHHFKIYSLRLNNITDKQQWLGLGLTSIAASKISKLVYKDPTINLKKLRKSLLFMKNDDEITTATINAMQSRLVDLEDLDYFGTNYKEIDMFNDWKNGNSVCISYNSKEPILMSFDIGEKIQRAKNYFWKQNNRNPVMVFLDDSSFYAKNFKEQNFNFSVQEIKNIGFNYRSLGIYNTMMVQSLGIIDENVAETYRIKLISPKFNNPEGLIKIGIPKAAISMLKNEQLDIDKKHLTMQWIMIDEHNEIKLFYPFLPPVNHFNEVYLPRGES